MHRILFVLMAGWMIAGAALAQTDGADTPFTASETQLITRTDAFDLEETVLIGLLTNEGDRAYANMSVFADLLDRDGEVIGEAFGFVVDTCGDAVLDFPVQPGATRRFEAQVDLFAEGDVADIVVSAQGTPTEPEPAPDIETTGLLRISEDEVVAVEWIDDNTLRYGVGCDNEVFIEHDWTRYDIASGESEPLDEHPYARFITDTMIQVTGITQVTQSRGTARDPALFDTSMLTFSPDGTRMVFQSDLNTLFSAAPDGSFRRLIADTLSRYTLQGFVWSPLGNFVAYYFGAYGDPVRYYTASANGTRISGVLPNTIPSQIIPGITDDGRTVIAGARLPDASGEEIEGYYYLSGINNAYELLYAAELPGNNYPAPAYYRRDDQTRYIYIVRDVDGQPTLQCIHREGDVTHTLTPLPLQLVPGEAAWTFLSPQRNWLALAADGQHGGLWLVDLNAFEECR